MSFQAPRTTHEYRITRKRCSVTWASSQMTTRVCSSERGNAVRAIVNCTGDKSTRPNPVPSSSPNNIGGQQKKSTLVALTACAVQLAFFAGRSNTTRTIRPQSTRQWVRQELTLLGLKSSHNPLRAACGTCIRTEALLQTPEPNSSGATVVVS